MPASRFRLVVFCAGCLAILNAPAAWSAQKGKGKAPALPQPTGKVLYKTIGDVKLHLHVFEPQGGESPRAAMVFFFGGGWNGGTPSQFYRQASHLAGRGMVVFCAEYRTKSKHGTAPDKCVSDGKSAIRYVRSHAARWKVDPDRIAAGGGSAGGHVAAATATVTAFDEPGEDATVEAVPNALVLFNPVYDNGPDGYGHARVKEHWRKFSPAHNIRSGMPPAIVFLGDRDKLIPVAAAEKFRAAMQDVGSRSELLVFAGEGHGFFNFGRGDGTSYDKTLDASDKFLTSLKFLANAKGKE